jgi:hypothetical protein
MRWPEQSWMIWCVADRKRDANFYDVQSGEEYWLSGPHRDRGDVRFSGITPIVDEDARGAYEAFQSGATLPGRERG